ncbi:MAG: N-acetylmuramoyl-L-alanine amidase [Spirochaetia bacterium]|nr:N-acetylmuramoyl-L-alanine amidase [Spirochaetia bacterium]
MGKISFRSKSFFLFTVLLVSNKLYGFRVVLDPGHGGRYIEPNSVYGDKYEPDKASFLEGYRPGASVSGLNENEDVYEISLIVKEFLDLTLTEKGRYTFYQILKKYDSSAKPPVEPIEALISRKSGYRSRYWEIDYDINRDYRLYDHEDLLSHESVEGVISRINALKPDLVVSIHLTGGNPGRNGGMAAVITPSYNVFYNAIDYVKADEQKRNSIRESFSNGAYGKWFISHHGRSAFEWFLCDAWIYYTGYWSVVDGLNPDLEKFRGFRHNMVTWSYRDESLLNNSSMNNPYISKNAHLKYFKPGGKFWEREKSTPENWRREGGLEGYGGDNLYASQEILRFIRKGLLVNYVYNSRNLPEIVTPYISTWSVPTYVNAVSAFLELAYLDNKYDFNRILKYKKIHAEAIAVGIYSLLQGTKISESAKVKMMPWGNSIDFTKYKTYNNSNYFDIVTH